jgi:hypothetical protein
MMNVKMIQQDNNNNNNNNFPYNVGSIIINEHTNQPYGVYIKKIGSSLYFFRLHDIHNPVFSKIDKIPPRLTKIGNINEEPSPKLKSELLKYYSETTLDRNDPLLLKAIMTFTFPNGIPKYDAGIPFSEKRSC